nr:multidrug resistance-associated protein 5 [Tanacetum cinerariifolium]
LNFYLDHLDMDLSEYLSQAITNKMDACVFKKIGPPKKRYCNEFSMDEMIDWAEIEVEQQEGVEARTSTIDKGKEKVSQDATKVVEARRSTVESDSESECDNDDDSDYQLDKSVDYLSPGKEELIELRNRMKANREAKAKAKDNLFKECVSYYALANGFSLWYERSCEARVVSKYGQRPPRLSDPGKVVNVKNKDNWSWFLELLEEDLGYSIGNRLTIMSDQYKEMEYGVCLNIKKRLEWLKEQQRFWHVIRAGGNFFEVRSRSEGFIVDEGKRTCSCRLWQLSGIPCVHATKVGSQASCSNYKKHGHKKVSCKEPVVEQTPKPKAVHGRTKKEQLVSSVEDVNVVLRGPVRDEGDGGFRGGASGSRGRGVQGRTKKEQLVSSVEDLNVVLRGPVRDEGDGGFRGGASGSRGRGGDGGSKGGADGSRRGASRSSGGASGSRGGVSVSKRGDDVSKGGVGGSIGGASGSKRKPVLSVGTQKRQGRKKVETFGFVKWFGLQDELDQTQDEPQQTQHEPM